MNDINRHRDTEASMNESPLDRLDRLVAGELDESSRREALAWCEREPEGWKRCALAFLEAQVWEQAFSTPGAIDGPAAVAKHETNGHASAYRGAEWVARAAPAKRPGESRGWRVGSATLACLLLAGIAIGAAIGRTFSIRNESPIVDSPHEKMPKDSPETVVESREQLVATVTSVGFGSARAGVAVQLPVVETGLTSAASQAQTPILPEYERRQWERKGWRVEPERKFLPAKLPDGSPVLVPIDRMRVSYQGRPAT